MKSGYITEENAKDKVTTWMKGFSPLIEKHKDRKFAPESSALLVIDMQKYFIDEDGDAYIPVGRFVLSQVKRLVSAYFISGLPVFFTRYGVSEQQKEDPMLKWWGEVLLTDDPQSFIVDELDCRKGNVVIKPGYSAFYKTQFDRLLKNRRVKQLVITGVLTHLCCETTAREAFQRGYDVYFVVDGTGTYNEEIHKASLWNLANGFAVPVTTEEITKKLHKEKV